ncbi:heavy metal-associated isoprenylated plant protein 35-like [Lolium rigidum]|uniref:heavy metal-associated isoprenylated plant protein 35-like n=1 Tax=Lolium rigidum TaxID=89674 RepID=UPI001F5C5E61|nr:heavy metal-associated isoprenylated plant protein 35-like [Lolium rigidum]
MASGQQALQTFVLRVSIHCHGCKKKVRKVLKAIEGVNEVKVDAQQHKVTVTGTVDAQTLIQRLQKSGKQALHWQNLHASPAKDPEPAPAATKAPAPAPAAEDGGKNDAPADKKPEEPVKEPQAESAEKKPEQEAAVSEKKIEAEDKKTESEKTAEKEEAKPSDEPKKGGGESESAEPAKEKATEPAKEAAAAPAKEASNGESEAKEKKQSKPKEVAAATTDRSLPPRHPHQEYSPYYAPQPVMSYHMAQPKASVSYYAPQPEQGYSMQQQPPQPQHGYSSSMNMMPPPQEAYSQQGQPMQQWSPSYLYMPYPHASPESYYQDYYSPPGTHAPAPPLPLQDSYRLFDDENPNSCSVM